MEVHYNKYCQKCTGKIVAHAFSEGKCEICDSEVVTSHMPCDKVCSKCSDEKDVCMSCGGPLRPIKLLQVDPISEETLIAMHNEQNPDQHTSIECLTFDEIQERYGVNMYAYSLKENKEYLEGLILSWRMKLKEKCEERAKNLRQASEWHEHDDEEFAIITEACFTPLKDFDEHFGITVQRHGHL